MSPYKAQLVERLSLPQTTLMVSDLARLECRVKPLRNGDQTLIGAYDHFFATAIERTIAISTEVIDIATDIRAHFGFATPDAIHLAAAIWGEADEFLTNDQQLRRFDRIRVVVVSTAS